MKVIKISAIWCPSCIIMTNVINKIKEEYQNLEFVNYDYDNDEEFVKKYDVGEILPVLIFLDNTGNEVKRLIGEKSKKEIEEIIESMISNEK